MFKLNLVLKYISYFRDCLRKLVRESPLNKCIKPALEDNAGPPATITLPLNDNSDGKRDQGEGSEPLLGEGQVNGRSLTPVNFTEGEILSATTSTSALMFAKDAVAKSQSPEYDENINDGDEECSDSIASESADNSGGKSNSISKESAVNDSEQHPRLDVEEQAASLNVENTENQKKTQDANLIKIQTKNNQETNHDNRSTVDNTLHEDNDGQNTVNKINNKKVPEENSIHLEKNDTLDNIDNAENNSLKDLDSQLDKSSHKDKSSHMENNSQLIIDYKQMGKGSPLCELSPIDPKVDVYIVKDGKLPVNCLQVSYV
jgi:hypothetical protein